MPTATSTPVAALTIEDLFDLIAPIAIYHGADVCFKAKALEAIRKLQRAVRKGDTTAVRWVGSPQGGFKWEDILEFEDLPNERDVRPVYNDLLIEIVSANTEGWEPGYDRSGCRCFRIGGRLIDAFCGDSPNNFAWYENAALVVERVQDHVEAEEAA